MRNFLVFDLGAGSGRAMLAQFDGERIDFLEVHRFSGIETRIADGPHWDLDRLLAEIEAGLERASRHCEKIDSIGVDSWGVDYALVGENGRLESAPFHYRHVRSQRGYRAFPIPPDELTRRTGSQALPVNTVYQMFSCSEESPESLKASRYALMIADAVNYHLCGSPCSNVTLARTTGMLGVGGRWDSEIVAAAGISTSLLAPLVQPGAVIGTVRRDLLNDIGLAYDIPVVAVAAHDTASAVCGIPLSSDEAFLICGSWSILGRELDHPLISDEAIQCGFGNEGGVEDRSIFLKSLNGLHLLQKLRGAWNAQTGAELGFSDMSEAAAGAAVEGRVETIDPSAPGFFDPPDLIAALERECPGLASASSNRLGALTLAVYRGLAEDVANALTALERIAGGQTKQLRICGGGGQDGFLCQIIADRTDRAVAVGPIEASAWGNAAMQLIGLGLVENLSQARVIVEKSANILNYYPGNVTVGP